MDGSWRLWGLCLLLAGGCVRLVDRPSPPATDIASVPDQRPGERGPGDDGDAHAVDGLAAVDGRRGGDGLKDLEVCAATIEVRQATSCAQQAVACNPSVDSDCDGLPNLRDPWSSTCNKLLAGDDFASPPSTAWSSTGTWSCGQVDLGVGASLQLKTPLAASDSSYLTEIRFTLGPASNQNQWAVTLMTAYVPSSNHHRFCELWVDPAYQQQPGLHAHLYALPLVPGCDGGTWTPGSNLPAADGTTYIMQVWSDSNTNRCRLYSADGALLVEQVFQTLCFPPSTGTVQVMTAGRAVSIDWVRVFDH